MTKRAYFFNREQKTESFGIIMEKQNYGPIGDAVCAAAREMLPSQVEKFQLLAVDDCNPFGSFVSEKVSIDFLQAVDNFKGSSGWLNELSRDHIALFPEEIRCLFPQGDTFIGKDVLEDINRLYVVKKFIEGCLEQPELFSFGEFEKLIKQIYMHGWSLKSLGFFIPVDNTPVGKYFIRESTLTRADHFVNLCTTDFERLESSLELGQLVRVKGNDVLANAVEVFDVTNGIDAVLISLFHLIQERVAVKRCGNCGKFFVPVLRSDALYCDRPAPQDSSKSCKEYGGKSTWYENMMNDEVTKTARNIYYAKRMLAKRNPDKPEYAEMFSYYGAERKKWEEQVKSGAKTREEYAEWLRKMKLCKMKAELEEMLD